MNGETGTNAVRRSAKMAVIFVLIWMLLVLVSVFSKLFGYGYLPSTSFLDETASLRVTVGLIWAVVTMIFYIKTIDIEAGELKKIVAVLVSPFIGYFVGSAPIAIGGPMLVAAIAGHHVELTYQVAKADGPGHKGCRSSVEIQDLPFLFDSLCGVPDDLRVGLKPGTLIVVEGRGTSFGVYATAFHRVDP